ncbi:nucleoside triphosphate pyrophosphohydrolase [Shewanella eurypsychrophilus]|uniref:Nucleoside triphosphate pyrophosphohydrolase n=1 Tax=Shewanella eurypsychrophilus TaxID=2593656 RepID=A0ABX6VKW0_9GAMM|nr:MULTISPECIES: nucleoside triphosphate pyrophosphohydrolase [Shewanella]QFU25397.1 nucleoside triphosphate pyrophosphohydrolase [Shewanella sp. YLB-09]QPG60539.1 nucleoside triphosphate pyrophosphohydrolase [Shewanella eurypsychrophilus]
MKTNEIEPLLDVMTKLRDPQSGCPWDLEQSFSTLVPFTLEEAYEVADTIERMALEELPDELGDLLFQVVFYCQLGKEQGLFDFADVVEKICNKLTSRHPHVFGALKEASAEQVKESWETIKAKERNAKSLYSVLDNIPLALPALSRSVKIQKRVARVGFDWAELDPVVAKIHEEIDEVLYEVKQDKPDSERILDEMGDLLFAVTNLARHLGVEPEQALRQANKKFERRFRSVETLANQSDKAMEEHTLTELDSYWNQVKSQESSNR